MTSPPASFVVDAGVALKLVLPELLADRATTLFGLLAIDPPAELHTPDLFYIECANTLWKYVRRGVLTEADAVADTRRLCTLTLCVIPTAALMEEALRLAIRHDISAYDACYVALSDLRSVPVVTADERLVRKLAGTAHRIMWLGDFIWPPAGSAAQAEPKAPDR